MIWVGVLGTPTRDHFAAWRYAARSVSSAARRSGSTGPLPAGSEKFAVRWNTVTCLAWRAISGIDCTPDEPVPITATRLPAKLTSSCGHRLVK
jgi:hypothetical protein